MLNFILKLALKLKKFKSTAHRKLSESGPPAVTQFFRTPVFKSSQILQSFIAISSLICWKVPKNKYDF